MSCPWRLARHGLEHGHQRPGLPLRALLSWFSEVPAREGNPALLNRGAQQPPPPHPPYQQEWGRSHQATGNERPVSPLQPEVKASISLFMAYVHTTVNEMSKAYLATERRYNYTTPKTFLEQIKLYQNLLAKKRTELVARIERLENGLMKLQSTASQVGTAGAPPAGPRTSPQGRETGLPPWRKCHSQTTENTWASL